MTAMETLTGAPTTGLSWQSINWTNIEKQVKRLQRRIAEATKLGRYGKAKALQWLLTHSLAAKLLAVRKVTQNKGGKTPGVEGVTWKTPKQKVQAAKMIKRRGYHSQPLKRIYIPKKNGKRRPLSIPTLMDRSVQALHLLALEPISETQADPNAYGFRPKRSCADAIEQCFNALSSKHSAQWILEGDIKACFDRISHSWLLNPIPMDRITLGKWLKAGYVEKAQLHATELGTPQGGIISPTLLVITLTGLEETVKKAVAKTDKVNIIGYADDFIVTGVSKEVLESRVKPAIEDFFAERGLELSKEKTHLTHIDDGFNFLGFNVRKYKGKLLIKPSKESQKIFLSKLSLIIKKSVGIKTEDMINQLNPKIRGWSNYFRHAVSKETFAYVDKGVFHRLWRWTKRRHPSKSAQWRKRKYFHHRGLRNWIFFCKTKNKDAKVSNLDLVYASDTKIKRHTKIRGAANPFDASYDDYFSRRQSKKSISSSVGQGKNEPPIF
ncbi:MAG: group II intron reverse transcriptase/maturase [Pseudomonadales bacterium]